MIRRDETPSERAAALVKGDRQDSYGHPLDNHIRIAAFWTVRFREKLKPGEVIEPHEVAAAMRLAKEARLMHTVGHQDSIDDIAGYADVEHLIHQEAARRADPLCPALLSDLPVCRPCRLPRGHGGLCDFGVPSS